MRITSRSLRIHLNPCGQVRPQSNSDGGEAALVHNVGAEIGHLQFEQEAPLPRNNTQEQSRAYQSDLQVWRTIVGAGRCIRERSRTSRTPRISAAGKEQQRRPRNDRTYSCPVWDKIQCY